ncbi:hypothetical protein COEREDRAFT_9052 [Coemansia reversa NRRL 1564]|uniref:Glycosyl transferase family 25 domain-containing protein n=1 Tax=Coemansia reversa (strain ATCC 12441 / NRRL 1564) TaxID=763665 RepID=A0A2G5B9X0_COERN|nr:hypothetical protein COEREDRAFT_9052 [Coemansia reversa NRRL 1564]|eukprot:PIA15816.1 hypothetical protein COEREDRAFT_9052 [Coemansia reversa NRRL 1564]
MIRAPPQAFHRLKVFVFLVVVVGVVILGSYMFASYIDEAAVNANYLALGFAHVFVPSERPHVDRRRIITRLLRYQGIPFGLFPATRAYDIDHPEAYSFWIGEQHWEPPRSNRTLSNAQLASFRTHLNLINEIVRLELASALVLSDSIDLDTEIKQHMHTIVPALPDSWDILFLGHCGVNETGRPTAFHPRLYVASNPHCMFAYALSRSAAMRLKRVLDNMWPNPQKPFEDVLEDMVIPMFFDAYVVHPPLVALLDPRSGKNQQHRLTDTTANKSTATPYTLPNSTLAKLGIGYPPEYV